MSVPSKMRKGYIEPLRCPVWRCMCQLCGSPRYPVRRQWSKRCAQCSTPTSSKVAMPAPLSPFLATIRRSPAWIVLLIGTTLLLVLLARGLNIGPLHTDVIIQRAWFHEVGVAGFPQRMFDSNLRHVLYGPLYALMYAL